MGRRGSQRMNFAGPTVYADKVLRLGFKIKESEPGAITNDVLLLILRRAFDAWQHHLNTVGIGG
jgi:hypothetical protein